MMELSTSTFAPWLSTLALQLIDRSLDHRPVGKAWFDKSFDLAGQMNKTLAKLTEFLSVCLSLYAHIL